MHVKSTTNQEVKSGKNKFVIISRRYVNLIYERIFRYNFFIDE